MAHRSSGDLTADRRYSYAMAAKEDGDLVAAGELLEQALELAPRWASAWFALGEVQLLLGQAVGARAAFGEALACEPADSHGASLKLAQLEGKTIAMPPAYIAGLFDDYAPRFDVALRGLLAYRGPELLLAMLEKAGAPALFTHALDLGCGTGLMGELLRPRCTRLEGVDLSAGMIAQANKRAIYDGLSVGDMAEWLAAKRSADLAIAADVFVYVRDLGPVFSVIAPSLAPGGWLAFSVQSHEGDGAILGDDMRYAHTPALVAQQLADAGFGGVVQQAASTRLDRGVPVPGMLFVARRL